MRPPDLEAQLQASLLAENWPEYDRIAAVMDQQDEAERARREGVTLAAAALWYAEQGLRVFPLQPESKIPYPGSRGCKDATTDAGQVRSWWKFQPDSNIGIATGYLVDVIDIDGPLGERSWAQAMWDDADTYVGPAVLGKVSTPRPGGRHLYIHADPDKGNRAGILPGVDYRSTGGYVVAPPSRTSVGGYEWYAPIDLTALSPSQGDVA
jgi:hypothetical protein